MKPQRGSLFAYLRVALALYLTKFRNWLFRYDKYRVYWHTENVAGHSYYRAANPEQAEVLFELDNPGTTVDSVERT